MPKADAELSIDATLLGFDYGQTKIGVAVGQQLTGTASPLSVLLCPNGKIDWLQIATLIEQWQPAALVVGVPLTEDGEHQPATRQALRFRNRLMGRFGLPVYCADERYTSKIAEQRFAELRAAGAVRRKRGKQDDAVAAQLILEQWMNDHSADAPTGQDSE